MYDDPLVIYREYIQNSADAIGNDTAGRVCIHTDPYGLGVRIRDNGPGLSQRGANRALLPVARSEKRRGPDRGFRGMGRLAGLAFAETVTFLTRTRGDALVSQVIWSGSRLRNAILRTEEFDAAIAGCVSVGAISGSGYPDHFFEVQITNVGRHAANVLLNRQVVRKYIAEVCPVPFASSFPFAADTEQILGERNALPTLEILVDDDPTPVTRRHGGVVHYSGSRTSSFSELEAIQISTADGSGTAAVGWVAHSSYLGAIPTDAGIRGIRAREGNMQIGDEGVFDSLFPEERFNRWCVGEIHILDSRIVPNGRRDYFEPGPHTRNLENQLAAVLHSVAARCRRASSRRNRVRRMELAMQRVEEAYELAASGYLSAADSTAMMTEAVRAIFAIRRKFTDRNEPAEARFEDLQQLERRLRAFTPKQGRPAFGSKSKQEIEAYRKVFYALAQVVESPRCCQGDH